MRRCNPTTRDSKRAASKPPFSICTHYICLLAIICCLSCASTTSTDVPGLRETVEKFQKDHGLPGIIVYDSFGVGDTVAVADDGRAGITDSVLFQHVRIASITKTITTTAALLLVKSGHLQLNKPIADYLQGRAAYDSITIGMLCANASGIGEYFEHPAFQEQLDNGPLHQWSDEELIQMGFDRPRLFAPGTSKSYSNTNYVLLGKIIEVVTGMSLQDFFQQKIFEPLGMRNSYYPADNEGHLRQPRVRGWFKRNGTLSEVQEFSPTIAQGAGAVISTLHDLIIWSREVVDGSLIGPDLQSQRLTTSTMPPNNTLGVEYGLGVSKFRGWIGHNGAFPGFQLTMYRHPVSLRTVIIIVPLYDDDMPHYGDTFFLEYIKP